MFDMGFWDLFFSIYFMAMTISVAACIGWHIPFGLVELGIWFFNKIAALFRKRKP